MWLKTCRRVSKNCLAIRTSILGFKDFNDSTLLEWIFYLYRKKINGFYDAYTSSLDVQSFCYYLNKLIDLMFMVCLILAQKIHILSMS